MKRYGPEPTRGRGNDGRNFRQRGKNPWWMRGVKGCFVCRRLDHHSRKKHSRDEVTAEINKPKMRYPTPLLTSKEHAYISSMYDPDVSEEEEESSKEEV